MKNQNEVQKIERGTAVAMFFCDEWKSTSSMSLEGIFTNRKKLDTAIRKARRNDDIILDNGNIRDLKNWDLRTINDNFDYIYLEEYDLNEVA